MENTKRQKEIINTAIDLIAAGGIQNFTMKSLAEDIGISEPAIYRHFKSKLEILVAILTSAGEEIQTFEHQKSLHETGSLEGINQMLQLQMKHFMDNPSLASIIFAEEIFQNEIKLADKVLSIMKGRFDLIERVIKMEQERGVVRRDISAKVLTNIILGAIRLLVNKWNLSGNEYDLLQEYSANWIALSQMIKR